jgi:polysaccharide biosynthesis transport protein
LDHPYLPPPGEVAVPASGRGYPSYSESAGYAHSYVSEPGSGLLEYGRILRRRKGAFILIALLGLLAGVLLTVTQIPIYQARTTLEIQDLNENFLNIKQVTPVSDGNTYTALTDIETQIKLLQSESLIKRVLVKLKTPTPGTSPEGGAAVTPAPAGPRGWASRVAAWRKALNLPEPLPADGFDPRQAARNLKVGAAGQTRIVELLYDSIDPHFAASFTNTLAQEFIDSSMEARWKMSQHTSQWLSRQLEDMRVKLERSEDALQAYARRSNLMFTSEGSNAEKTNIAEDKLRQLQEELSKAQGDRITKQAHWELSKTSPAEALPDVLNGSSLRALQDKLTEFQRRRAELITIYTDKHSKVKQVEAQIQPIEAALQKERAQIVGRLRNDYEAALRREKLLASDYATQSRLVTDQAEKSIQYNILKREVDSNRRLYEAMLQRVKESGIASAMRASNVRIVDLAEPPAHPYKPSLPINSALGLLSGLFAGVVFVIMRERADCSLQNPGDTPFWLNIPELGVIPRAAKELHLLLRLHHSHKHGSLGKPRILGLIQAPTKVTPPHGDPGTVSDTAADGDGKLAGDCMELLSGQRKSGPVAESFRSVLTSILFSGENGTRPRVLVVTSANPMEGKTTVTSNLGIAFAGINHKVLLIDGDLRKPRLHEIFGVSNDYGLSTVLGEDPIDCEVVDSVLRQTGITGVSVLPSGPADQNTANLLYSANLPELLARFKGDFDMVIIDTPPMQEMPDARVLGRLADGVILVTRAGQTTRDAAIAANERFCEDRTRVLGTVLNDWNPKSSAGGHYGNYKGGYAHDYGRIRG